MSGFRDSKVARLVRCSATVVAAALFLLTFLAAHGAVRADVPPAPNHFIIVIDTSGDMAGWLLKDGVTKAAIPRALFRAWKGANSVPRIKRGDQLSLVSFDLRKGDAKCPGPGRYDLSSLDNLFKWHKISSEDYKSEEAFSQYLDKWLREECRHGGGVSQSPILTAELLAADFVGKKFSDKNVLFDKTFLLVATNDAYNGSTARELAEFAVGAGGLRDLAVANTDAAAVLVEQFNEHYRLKTSLDWRRLIASPAGPFMTVSEWAQQNKPEAKPLSLTFSELLPRVPDNAALIEYDRSIGLQREGFANGRVEIVDRRGLSSRVLLKKRPDLQPVEISFRFSSSIQAEGAWVKNGQPAASRTIDFTTCAGDDACQELVKANDDGLAVNLLKAAFGGNGDQLSGEETLPPPGVATFDVVYRYAPGSYDAMRHIVRDQTIRIDTASSTETVRSRFLARDELLTNTLLVQAATPEGTLASDAVTWINSDRDRWRIAYLVVLIVGIILFIRFLHRRYGGKKFAPLFSWQPAGTLAIDFEQLPENEMDGSHILAGTLAMENLGRWGWFARVWPSEGEPQRSGKLGLDVILPDRGVVVRGNPGELIGFLDATDSGRAVVRRLYAGTLVHGGRWHVFVDTGAVEDGSTESLDTEGRLDCPVTLEFRPEWSGRKADDRPALWSDSVPNGRCIVPTQLLAERQKPPKVKYEAATEKLTFAPHRRVRVGTFCFRSAARRRFAQAATYNFALQGVRSTNGVAVDMQLSLEAIGGGGGELHQLPSGWEVALPPMGSLDCDVLLCCDDQLVVNPELQVGDLYNFRLRGETAEGAVSGPYEFRLLRDTTGPIPVFKTEVGHERCELYWSRRDSDGSPCAEPGELHVRRLAIEHDSTSQESDTAVDDKVVTVRRDGSPLPVRFKEGEESCDLLFVELGNAGRRGNGKVRFRWTAEITAEIDDRDNVLSAELKLDDADISPDQLIRCVDRGSPRGDELDPDEPLIIDGDEEAPRLLKFVLDTGRITAIASGRVEGLALKVTFRIDIERTPRARDRDARDNIYIAPPIAGSVLTSESAHSIGEPSMGLSDLPQLGIAQPTPLTRCAVLRLPFSLEKMPAPYWLCIDFGTSAVAAAIGTEMEPYVIPLQNIVGDSEKAEVRQGRNLADFDLANSEAGTRFLPSYIICDADIRRTQRAGGAGKTASDDYIEAGFPGYPKPDLRPGEAAFIGLPASSKQLRENPDRIVYSLKSWLAHSGDRVPLPKSITYQLEGGRETTTVSVPLDPLVESTFNALESAYLSPSNNRAEKLVITHPNTFTPLHLERLRRCVAQSLGRKFQIPAKLDDRIRLISESDAVAYFYCDERRKSGFIPPARERILVYDFGAGTLDLSLVEVAWNREPIYPLDWTVEERLGVPVAGNHLDSLIARMIHQRLRTEKVVPRGLEYRYPIVGMQLKDDRHRIAANDLAAEIGMAKKRWSDEIAEAAEGFEQNFRTLSPFDVSLGNPGAAAGMIGPKGGEKPKGQGKDSDKTDDKFLANLLPESGPDGKQPSLYRRGNMVHLSIPAREVHGDPGLNAFIEFAAEKTVQTLLASAGRKPEEVDTVVVSGRGALWPGLKDRVERQFPQARRADFYKTPELMKEAVVRGALAWQQLREDMHVKVHDRPAPPLAVCLTDGTLYPLEPGARPRRIDLGGSPVFTVLQCQVAGLNQRPPKGDLTNWFFVDVFNREFERARHWTQNPYLFASVEKIGPHSIVVRLLNSDGIGFTLDAAAHAAHVRMRPPWPIGSPILPPEER